MEILPNKLILFVRKSENKAVAKGVSMGKNKYPWNLSKF
jgi:hypothetical protein